MVLIQTKYCFEYINYSKLIIVFFKNIEKPINNYLYLLITIILHYFSQIRFCVYQKQDKFFLISKFETFDFSVLILLRKKKVTRL